MKDGQNSVRRVVDTAGTVVASYGYDAFGNRLSTPNAIDGLFHVRAFGEIQDPNLGFTDLRARWMDPGTGRFASKDPLLEIPPLEEDGDLSFDAPPPYGYAAGNPVDHLDPSGRFWGHWHRSITQNALTRFSKPALEYVVAGNLWVDQGIHNQRDAFNPWHSMRDPGQSLAAAVAERDAQIDIWTKRITDAPNLSDDDIAEKLQSLGHILHSYQDEVPHGWIDWDTHMAFPYWYIRNDVDPDQFEIDLATDISTTYTNKILQELSHKFGTNSVIQLINGTMKGDGGSGLGPGALNMTVTGAGLSGIADSLALASQFR